MFLFYGAAVSVSSGSGAIVMQGATASPDNATASDKADYAYILYVLLSVTKNHISDARQRKKLMIDSVL